MFPKLADESSLGLQSFVTRPREGRAYSKTLLSRTRIDDASVPESAKTHVHLVGVSYYACECPAEALKRETVFL